MSNHSNIKIQNAVFGYRTPKEIIEVIASSNLDLTSGNLVGVVGVNGSGKSTFLKSLCGLTPLLSGLIHVDGKTLPSYSAHELAKKISVVLTEKFSGFNLTCFDAVAAGQMPYTNLFNKLEKEHLKIIEEAIQACGLGAHRNKLLSELSDGLFQKTMIAKCLAQQTPFIFLDEPSAFLDFVSKHELFILLKKLSSEKCILVSSHDLELIRKYCSEILLVKNSTIEKYKCDEESWHTVFDHLSGGFL